MLTSVILCLSRNLVIIDWFSEEPGVLALDTHLVLFAEPKPSHLSVTRSNPASNKKGLPR